LTPPKVKAVSDAQRALTEGNDDTALSHLEAASDLPTPPGWTA
jgi:hypothetical protein